MTGGHPRQSEITEKVPPAATLHTVEVWEILEEMETLLRHAGIPKPGPEILEFFIVLQSTQ